MHKALSFCKTHAPGVRTPPHLQLLHTWERILGDIAHLLGDMGARRDCAPVMGFTVCGQGKCLGWSFVVTGRGYVLIQQDLPDGRPLLLAIRVF